METMREIIAQETIEQHYNRKHIDARIRSEIEGSNTLQLKVKKGIEFLEAMIEGKYYASKMARMEQLKGLDLRELVMECFIGIAYCLRPELLSSVAAQLSSRLGFSDKVVAITTVADIIAELCNTDAFDIQKANKQASLMVVSRMRLPDELVKFMEGSRYLPPMVCEPLELTHNYSSGYLTHNDSLLLGSGNHHDGDLCLDVLNTMNKTALKLDLDFLCNVEEEPTFELDTQEKVENWMAFKKQSYDFYKLMQREGNRFYLTHKVDKRGRIYSQGYHINTQGSSFKKAMVELAKEEVITGVPL